MTTCKHFGSCGGCTYLDIPYHDELSQKEALLRETLGPHGHLLEGIIPAPSPLGYRNKMEFAFGDECKDGQLALGIRKRRSYYEVATLEDCILIPDDFKQIALCVQAYFHETGDAFFHRKRHTGSLRHLVLRRGEFTGEVLVNLSTTSRLTADLTPLISRLLELKLDGQIVGILHSVNNGVADTVKDDDIRILHGRDYFRERICGLDFTVSAFSFFQTNSAGAEKLYGVVRDMATGVTDATGASAKGTSHAAACQSESGTQTPSFKGSDAHVTPDTLAYDLYCGTGTIAQILSPGFNKVIGIELNADAIKAAKENARLNNITNCEFYAGDVTDVLNSCDVMKGPNTICGQATNTVEQPTNANCQTSITNAQNLNLSPNEIPDETFDASPTELPKILDETFNGGPTELPKIPDEAFNANLAEMPKIPDKTFDTNPAKMPDVVIVDPPRNGLHPKALAKLIQLAPPRLVYVACKPESLTRDMAALTEAGYQTLRIMGVDMFPRTPHVEAVALLEKR